MRLRVVVVLLLGLLAAAGCAASADSSAEYDQADVRFNQQMIIHHRETIKLAELAAERGGSAYVRDLSAEIIPAEQADIRAMEGWLKSWNEQVPADQATGQGAELPAGSGFDRGWLTMLSKHLEHGVHMAHEVQGTGKHRPTRELAVRIVREQGEQLAAISEHLT